MGLLDHLWDETVAGPRPDSGLGKLRKYSSFSSTSSSSSSASSAASAATAPGSSLVTRSITILRTTSFPRSALDSASSSPSSPASVPDSPLTPTGPRGEWWRLRKKPTPVAEGMETAEPRNPDVYDWVLISSLDR
ncbi:dormancy-associated protein homolog 3-like [Phoenix dactylifera]|uniref:Dormancy-associated protein homolog 3-like n=1 Tax=Phoenix dactylifera TaxID=42345 RepID=A0A8B9AM67_PHODC|nr:dormancy-associated protein homolog 3-like [Phoenix dactylifera]